MWETNNIQSPVYSSEWDTRLSLYVTTINISDNKNNSIFFYYLSFGKRVETCEKNVNKSYLDLFQFQLFSYI